MEGLVEIQKWLHVWTEAERARRLNKKPADGARVNPENRVEEGVREGGITQPSCKSTEEPASPRLRVVPRI